MELRGKVAVVAGSNRPKPGHGVAGAVEGAPAGLPVLTRAALGFRAHSGWAAMVVVAGSLSDPIVLHRGRIELVDSAAPRSWQPYHAAAEMELSRAEAFLDRCANVANSMAAASLRSTLAELRDEGYEIAGCGLLLASGRPLGDLAKTLASHPAIHTAEGEFFRNAVKLGAESCGLPVAGIKEKDLLSGGAAGFGISEDELIRRISAVGKSIGPPWRLDEKYCALAAWLVTSNLRR